MPHSIRFDGARISFQDGKTQKSREVTAIPVHTARTEKIAGPAAGPQKGSNHAYSFLKPYTLAGSPCQPAIAAGFGRALRLTR